MTLLDPQPRARTAADDGAVLERGGPRCGAHGLDAIVEAERQGESVIAGCCCTPSNPPTRTGQIQMPSFLDLPASVVEQIAKVRLDEPLGYYGGG